MNQRPVPRLRRSPLVLAVVAAALALGTGAFAAWSGGGDGESAGRALTMPGGSAPTAAASGSDVVLRWPAAAFPSGTPVEGYVIRRYGINGAAFTVAASCSGEVTGTTCTEHNVPAGSWTYTDTPVQGSWTGAESPPGNTVGVG